MKIEIKQVKVRQSQYIWNSTLMKMNYLENLLIIFRQGTLRL